VESLFVGNGRFRNERPDCVSLAFPVMKSVVDVHRYSSVISPRLVLPRQKRMIRPRPHLLGDDFGWHSGNVAAFVLLGKSGVCKSGVSWTG